MIPGDDGTSNEALGFLASSRVRIRNARGASEWLGDVSDWRHDNYPRSRFQSCLIQSHQYVAAGSELRYPVCDALH